MTDITEERRESVRQLLNLSISIRDIINRGIDRFSNILTMTEPDNPIAGSLIWDENIVAPHQEEYQLKLAELRALVDLFPEEIA